MLSCVTIILSYFSWVSYYKHDVCCIVHNMKIITWYFANFKWPFIRNQFNGYIIYVFQIDKYFSLKEDNVQIPRGMVVLDQLQDAFLFFKWSGVLHVLFYHVLLYSYVRRIIICCLAWLLGGGGCEWTLLNHMFDYPIGLDKNVWSHIPHHWYMWKTWLASFLAWSTFNGCLLWYNNSIIK